MSPFERRLQIFLQSDCDAQLPSADGSLQTSREVVGPAAADRAPGKREKH